jgi:general secretion pathway protein M
MKQAWNEFWQARNARERAILTYGGAFLLLAMLYGLAWLPVSEGRKKLTKNLPQLRVDVAQMRTNAKEIIGLQGNTDAASGEPKQAVESALQAANLREKVSAIDRVDAQRVRLTLTGTPFDALLMFLENMQSQQKLRVEGLQIQATNAGRVKGSVTLVGPGNKP